MFSCFWYKGKWVVPGDLLTPQRRAAYCGLYLFGAVIVIPKDLFALNPSDDDMMGSTCGVYAGYPWHNRLATCIFKKQSMTAS